MRGHGNIFHVITTKSVFLLPRPRTLRDLKNTQYVLKNAHKKINLFFFITDNIKNTLTSSSELKASGEQTIHFLPS